MPNDFVEVALPAFSFLLADGRYHLVEQEAPSFDNGFLLFESSQLHIHVVRERGEFFIEFASSTHPSKSYWYDFDVVRRFLDGATRYEPDASGIFTSAVPFAPADALSTTLRNYLPRVETAFATDQLLGTEKALDRLRRQRGRVIFR